MVLPHQYRLKKKGDFQNLFHKGNIVAGRYVVLYYRLGEGENLRFGFVVSRKIGKAVQRNKIKRWLREMCRQRREMYKKGFDIILVARQKIKGIPYHVVEKEMVALSRRAGLLAE